MPIKTFSHVTAACFTQIDYDREMALVLTETGAAGTTEIFGIVRISADPDSERTEFAIVVRGDVIGMEHGSLLMRRIIDYARGRGIGGIFGDVLRKNSPMLKLCGVLGSSQHPVADDPGIVRVRLKL